MFRNATVCVLRQEMNPYTTIHLNREGRTEAVRRRVRRPSRRTVKRAAIHASALGLTA